MALSRITITIPSQLVEAADRRAGELDRSRSWVVVDALKAYLARDAPSVPSVSETATPYMPGLGPSRRAQLEADLALSPEERVRLAEQTALVAEVPGRTRQRDRVIAFDRHEDFLAWERRESLGL